MPKYREKPAVVEAEQFFPWKAPWLVGVLRGSDDGYFVQLGLGTCPIIESDWVVDDADGLRSVLTDGAFKRRYEEVIE